MIGGPEERADVAAVSAMMKTPVIDLAGATTVGLLPALLSKASLLVTNDSGPMHIAAAVGTPVVALFGPTSAVRTGPYGAGHDVLDGEGSLQPLFQPNVPPHLASGLPDYYHSRSGIICRQEPCTPTGGKTFVNIFISESSTAVGGQELAVLLHAEGLVKRGHDLRLILEPGSPDRARWRTRRSWPSRHAVDAPFAVSVSDSRVLQLDASCRTACDSPGQQFP